MGYFVNDSCLAVFGIIVFIFEWGVNGFFCIIYNFDVSIIEWGVNQEDWSGLDAT